MTVSVTYEPEPRDFADALGEVGNRGLGRILRYGLGIGIPAVETVLIVSDPAARSDPARSIVDVLIWWLVFPPLFLGFIALVRRWSIRRFIKDDATHKGTQVRRLDSEGLHISGPGHSATLSWSVLRSAVETSRFFLIFQTRDAAYFLPKRAMSPDAIAQARALLRDRLPSSRLLSN